MLRERPIYSDINSLSELLSVNIHGNRRVPKYTEAIEMAEPVFEQAREVGLELTKLSKRLPGLIQDESLRRAVGISQQVYEREYQPFIDSPHQMLYFGADAILETNDQIKIIEINTRPQFLGRYDLVTPLVTGSDNPNAKIAPNLGSVLGKITPEDSIGVVVSHPANAFHNHHKLFAEQVGLPVIPLQSLVADPEGNVVFQGRKVGLIFRQFNTTNLLNPNVTNPDVLDAIKSGRVQMVNGPIANLLGEKPLLPFLPSLGVRIEKYLPKMKVVKTGEEINLKEYANWWLKGETKGQIELVFHLTKQNLQGWPGEVVRSILAGNITHAKEVLEGRVGSTADRMREHITDIEKSVPGVWLLQENIRPKNFSLVDEAGQEHALYTTLRLYFVVDPGREDRIEVRLEFLGSKQPRVSAAGFTIPVWHRPPSPAVAI